MKRWANGMDPFAHRFICKWDGPFVRSQTRVSWLLFLLLRVQLPKDKRSSLRILGPCASVTACKFVLGLWQATAALLGTYLRFSSRSHYKTARVSALLQAVGLLTGHLCAILLEWPGTSEDIAHLRTVIVGMTDQTVLRTD